MKLTFNEMVVMSKAVKEYKSNFEARNQVRDETAGDDWNWIFKEEALEEVEKEEYNAIKSILEKFRKVEF